MHSCEWAGGSAIIIDSETESTHCSTEAPYSLIIDGGCSACSNMWKGFPPCSAPASAASMICIIHCWSDSELAQWDWIAMCNQRLIKLSFTQWNSLCDSAKIIFLFDLALKYRFVSICKVIAKIQTHFLFGGFSVRFDGSLWTNHLECSKFFWEAYVCQIWWWLDL